MDGATINGRDDSGRTSGGPDSTSRRKTRRHSGSDTPTIRSMIPEQTSIRQKAPVSRRSRSEVEGSRLFGRIGDIPLDFRVFLRNLTKNVILLSHVL